MSGWSNWTSFTPRELILSELLAACNERFALLEEPLIDLPAGFTRESEIWQAVYDGVFRLCGQFATRESLESITAPGFDWNLYSASRLKRQYGLNVSGWYPEGDVPWKLREILNKLTVAYKTIIRDSRYFKTERRKIHDVCGSISAAIAAYNAADWEAAHPTGSPSTYECPMYESSWYNLDGNHYYCKFVRETEPIILGLPGIYYIGFYTTSKRTYSYMPSIFWPDANMVRKKTCLAKTITLTSGQSEYLFPREVSPQWSGQEEDYYGCQIGDSSNDPCRYLRDIQALLEFV